MSNVVVTLLHLKGVDFGYILSIASDPYEVVDLCMGISNLFILESIANERIITSHTCDLPLTPPTQHVYVAIDMQRPNNNLLLIPYIDIEVMSYKLKRKNVT